MLDNNSKEMKTIVETFIVEETAELIYDNDKLDKWNEMINELKLEGQSKIVQKDKSPIPFMPMNQVLVNTFSTLLPRHIDVKKYNVSPIPVEILELVSLSSRENYFTRIEIWYDDRSKDPACIGIVEKYGEWNNYNWDSPKEASIALSKEISSWNKEERKYLIGKWADVKQSFEELKERAMVRFKKEREAAYRAQVRHAQRSLDDLEIEAFNMFN